MPAKVKNHAIVQRGLVLSPRTSDYIYAGTQVLLNTLSLVPFLPPLPPVSVPPPLCPSVLLFSSVLPMPSPGTNGYLLYKSQNMFPCLYPTACKAKTKTQKRKESRPSLSFFRFSIVFCSRVCLYQLISVL